MNQMQSIKSILVCFLYHLSLCCIAYQTQGVGVGMVRVQNCIRTASAAGGRRRKARWWWLVCVTANPALSKNRCINFSSLTFGKTNPFLEKFLSQLQYRDYYVQLCVCVYSIVIQCIVYGVGILIYICHSFIIRYKRGYTSIK